MNSLVERRKTTDKVLILVEGKSDLAFLSLFLVKNYGFTYIDKISSIALAGDNLNHFAANFNQQSSWYKNPNYFVHIFAVGGKDSFGGVWGDLVIKKIENSQYYKKIIIITDRDEDSDDDIRKRFEFLGIEKVEINKEQEKVILSNNGFTNYTLQLYLSCVPYREEGSLETLIENEYRKYEPILTEHVNQFMADDEKKYLKEQRIVAKAKIGLLATMIKPDATFSDLQTKFSTIDISDELITTAFEYLSFLKP